VEVAEEVAMEEEEEKKEEAEEEEVAAAAVAAVAAARSRLSTPCRRRTRSTPQPRACLT